MRLSPPPHGGSRLEGPVEFRSRRADEALWPDEAMSRCGDEAGVWTRTEGGQGDPSTRLRRDIKDLEAKYRGTADTTPFPIS